MHPQATPTRLPRWGPRRRRRCSSFKYSRYSQSSRLAGGAPRSSRCDARLSPRAVEPSAARAPVLCDDVAPEACMNSMIIGVALVVAGAAAAAQGQDRMPPIPAEKLTEAQKKAIAEFKAARSV